MSRPSKPWLLPVACIVMGVVWALWLASQQESPAYEKEATIKAASEPAPSLPSTPQGRPSEQSDKDSTGSRSASRVAPVSSGAPAAEKVQSSTERPLQVVFQAPPGARVGENFDVRVTIVGTQAVARIVVEVAYDPSLLKVRTLEEIDYAMRAVGERAFSISQSSEGQVELVLRRREGALALPLSAPLVQFEAIAAGSTDVRISSVGAYDSTDRSLPWSAIGRESRIIAQ